MCRLDILKWVFSCCCGIMAAIVFITVNKQHHLRDIAKIRSLSSRYSGNRSYTKNKEATSYPKNLTNSSISYTSPNYLHSTTNFHNINLENENVKVIRLKTKAKYLISEDNIEPQCENNSECIRSKNINWRMYIFVKSSASNFDRRKYIRTTWGSFKYIAGGQFSTFFVIGRAATTSQQNLLDEEAARFNDILQLDEPDGYKFVGLKTLAGMEWASSHLKNNDFYTSCDDDMVINVGELQNFVDRYIKEQSEKKWPEFPIICSYEIWEHDSKPIRSNKHANYVSVKEYRWPHWPKFCLGGMYTTSVSVIRQLFEISRTQAPLLNTDDVWITGILRNILGMPSTMLIKSKPALAHHLGPRHNAANSPKLTIWQGYFNAFKTKPLCKC